MGLSGLPNTLQTLSVGAPSLARLPSSHCRHHSVDSGESRWGLTETSGLLSPHRGQPESVESRCRVSWLNSHYQTQTPSRRESWQDLMGHFGLRRIPPDSVG